MLENICTSSELVMNGGPNPVCNIPDELICPLCGDLLSDAIMLPCCAVSTCDACARDALSLGIEEGTKNCPLEECASTDTSVDDLIPNRRLRQKASVLRKNSPYVFGKQPSILSIATGNQNIAASKPLIPTDRREDICISETYSGSDILIEPEKTNASCDGSNKYPETVVQAASKSHTVSLKIEEANEASSCLNEVINVKQNSTHDIMCDDVTLDDPDLSTSVSYNLQEFHEDKAPEINRKLNLILAEKEIDIEFNESSSTEPAVPGEESANELNKGINDVKKKINTEKVHNFDRKNISTSDSSHKNAKGDFMEHIKLNTVPLRDYNYAQSSHQIAIPAKYLSEAVDDPLAAFNKLMAVRDREKGIMNSLEHYGPPREYHRRHSSPVQNRMHYSYQSEYSATSNRGYPYANFYSNDERISYNHNRCYYCDRYGHVQIDCPERHSPPRTSYRRDYRRYHDTKRSYTERTERDDFYHTINEFERRSPPPAINGPKRDGKKKSKSPSPDQKKLESSIEEMTKYDSPYKKNKPEEKSPVSNKSKQKKSKFKDERDRPSPVAKKITKKKKDKRETKEISTVFEVNAHVRERCTKTKKVKKKKNIQQNIRSPSLITRHSRPQNFDHENTKLKKKRKKSDRALQILDKEILQLLSKDFQAVEKELLIPAVKRLTSPTHHKEKTSKKIRPEKCSSKSSKKSKHKHSEIQKHKIAKLREQNRIREDRQQRKRSKKY